MGCASWRSHHRLLEHAAFAPLGGAIRGGAVPTFGSADVLGLNEVGVTDLVMVTIWRYGPSAAAYAVSPAAEAHHLGSDIAIIHPATTRVLLYQAKLAYFDSDAFLLKSPVTIPQMRLLNRRTVTLNGTVYTITGRLALYQATSTPFIQRCRDSYMYTPLEWWDRWWGLSESVLNQREPELGRRYYEEVLVPCGCSPSGIVACSAPLLPNRLRSVPASQTWPWEFDFYEWVEGSSPLDSHPWSPRARVRGRRRAERGDPATQLGQPPDFRPYRPTVGEPAPEAASETAVQLAQQLRLPVSRRLHVVVLG